MLRTIRLTTAIVCFTLITLLFLDFTGTLHTWFGWLAKIQFLPALLALNIGVVLFLVVLTFLFGRIYCWWRHYYSGVFIVRSFVLWEYFRMLFRGYPANKRKTGSVIHQQ